MSGGPQIYPSQHYHEGKSAVGGRESLHLEQRREPKFLLDTQVHPAPEISIMLANAAY